MARTVHVDLGDRSYDIHIGFPESPGGSLGTGAGTRCLIVSDSNVDPLYGDRCEACLRDLGAETSRVVVAAGEATKSTSQAAALCSHAAAAGLDRHSVIVALGGGVVGDLAGFVAATYLRGVRFIQVPTTLLAMVDSSVGGKTGVNLPEGKNLVGCFHQPIEVSADLATLESLPDREYVSGLAEVVKYGVIWDAALFDRLERETGPLLARDRTVLEAVVGRCCEIKAEVVGQDERESGVRAILNFGHTLGHALENAAGYGELRHGEAVAVGMAYAARLSMAETGFSGDECDRLLALLGALGLPASPREAGVVVAWPDLETAMASDKKALRSVARFVLVEKLGSVVSGREVLGGVLATTFDRLDGNVAAVADMG